MRRAIVDWLSGWVGRDWAAVLAPGWFTFAGLAAIAAGLLAARLARQRGEDPERVLRAIAWGYVAAVVCGIAGPALWDATEQVLGGRAPRLRWAGMTSWAGFAGGFGVMAWVWRRSASGAQLMPLFDLLVAPLGLALVFARLGCFVAGCDFGKVTSAPWGVRFPAGSPAWNAHVSAGLVPRSRAWSLPVHPTQLYEALLGLIIALAALWLARTAWARARAGRLALVGVLLYAAGRFAIEDLRADLGRGFLGPLSLGQAMSIAVASAAAVVLVASRRRALATAVAAALLAVTLGGTRFAAAQETDPQPVDPYGGSTVPTTTAPAPTTTAPAPTTTAPAPPSPSPPQTARPPAPQAAPGVGWSAAGFVGAAAALNRRNDQVPQLTGLSLSGTFDIGGGLGLGVDIDGMANQVAAHRSFLFAGEVRRAVGSRLGAGLRLGFGVTNVDFADPAFRDLVSFDVRAGITSQLAINHNWMIALWPMTLDFIGSAALGGPITTYQLRLGIVYRSRPFSGINRP